MNPTVLVVDDEALVVESLRRQLRAEYNVLTSTEPTAALANAGGYDVALVDYYMPQMNGADFLSLVRQAQPWVRRVLITGGTAFEIAQKAVDDAQVHRFLVKPVTTRHLSQTLRGLFASSLTSPSGSVRRERRTVLIVDDSELAGDATRLSLEAGGFRVIFASDPREISSVARVERPDIVLLAANSLPLCPARLSALLPRGELPVTTRVLLHAALPAAELKEAAARCGADGYVRRGDFDLLHELEEAVHRQG